MRDINLGDTIYPKFTTRAFATGVPATLAGTPVLSVYEENNLTQITAGVSVTVDYDSVTGLNQATIVATSGNGYEAGKSYDLVITTGTVGGVSVVGEVVFSFTVEDTTALMPTTAGRSLDVTATGEAGIDLDNVNGALGTANFDADFLTAGLIADNAFVAANFAASSLDGKGDWNIGKAGYSLTATTGLGNQTSNITGNLSGSVGSVTAGVSLGAGAITNASLAENMEVVFETDFATNYNTTRNAWATNVQDQVGTGNFPSDIIAISGDTGAADNLELMYDGTGYVDDTAPASRSQVDSIGSSSGGAIYFAIEADNTGGAIKGVTLVGSQAGTFADTEAEDGTYHAITHSGNAIDIVYQANVGATRLAIEVDFVGYLTSSNDTITVQAYDFIGADWETRRVITGQNGTGNISQSIKLLSKHTGSSGTDLGLVLIRFVNTGMTAPVLNVDELLVAAVSNSNTLGFEGGAVWIDTVGGTSGTGQGVGTITTPSSNISDAITIATANNLKRFHFLPGSSETFAAAMDDYAITGHDYTLAFGGQSIAGSYISGATVSGTFTGTTAILEDCIINAITGPGLTMRRCFFNEVTITNNGTAGWYLNDCRSRVAGTGSASFDFGAAALNTGLSLRAYSGGIELENMGQAGTDNASIEGDGNITLNANCVGGTLVIRGNFDLTDNSATTTITQTARPANRFTGIEGATFDTSTDSLEAIRNRGDTAWITGGGGGLTQILNVQPMLPFGSIDLADTATVRLGLILINSLDDLPTTAEITPGTISIERKAIGGTSWSAVVTDAAMSEQAGAVFYDEVFDSGSGYAEGDSIRITFKSVSITADTNTHEICDANGIFFQNEIRQTMRGTDGANTTVPDAAGVLPSATEIYNEFTSGSNEDAFKADVSSLATAAALVTAQNDLDILTGSDGVTLATSQPNYAPNTVVPDAAGTAPTAVQIRQEIDANSTQLNTTIPGLIDDLAIKKNTAFSNFEFLMVLTSDHVTPATGLTVTGQRSIDGGAFASVSGTIAEVSNGIYQFDALAADTNGDVITWRFSSATADDTFVTFKTVA